MYACALLRHVRMRSLISRDGLGMNVSQLYLKSLLADDKSAYPNLLVNAISEGLTQVNCLCSHVTPNPPFTERLIC